MKMFLIARKTIIEAWREPQLLLVFILFPPMMVLLYYFAYGQGNQAMSRYLNVMVLNQDQGELGAQFVDALRDEKFDGSPVYSLEVTDSREKAFPLLSERKAAMLLIIPQDFSDALATGTARLTIVADPLSDTAVFARSFLSGTIDTFSDRLTGWNKPLPVSYEYVTGTGTTSDFQYGVPGLVIFGVLFGIITSAMILTRETVKGTLQRMRLAGVKSRDLVGGIVLTQMGAAILQLVVTFSVAYLCGFRSPGAWWLMAVIVLVLSLAATGFGMVTACFARSDGEAASLGTAFMAPLVFLSGAIFPMPAVPIGKIAGRSINLYDLLPSTHASEALRRVMVFGDGAGSLIYELVMLTALTVVSLVLGVWLFQRLRLKHG